MTTEGWIKLVLAILCVLGLVAIGWHYGAKGVQTAWDKDRAAQMQALAQAQARVIEAENEQQAATEAIENDYAQKLKLAHDDSDRLTLLLVRYKQALSAGAVPKDGIASSGPAPSPAQSSGPTDLDQAIGNSVQACEADAVELQSLQDWVLQTYKIFNGPQ